MLSGNLRRSKVTGYNILKFAVQVMISAFFLTSGIAAQEIADTTSKDSLNLSSGTSEADTVAVSGEKNTSQDSSLDGSATADAALDSNDSQTEAAAVEPENNDTSASQVKAEQEKEDNQIGQQSGSFNSGEAYRAQSMQRRTLTVDVGTAASRKELSADSVKNALTKQAAAIDDAVKPVPQKVYRKKTFEFSKLKRSEKVFLFTAASSAVAGGVITAIIVNSLRNVKVDRGIPEPPPPPGH